MPKVTFATAMNESDKWRTNIACLDDPDILSWINNLYQGRRFPTRQEFNETYDRGDNDVLNWRHRLTLISSDDVSAFEEIFGETYSILIFKMKAALECDKIILVY